MRNCRKYARNREWVFLLYVLNGDYTIKNAEFFTSDDFEELKRLRVLAEGMVSKFSTGSHDQSYRAAAEPVS